VLLIVLTITVVYQRAGFGYRPVCVGGAARG
jgi:hypothetical protein